MVSRRTETAPMSVETPRIDYQEQHELGFLERLLLGKVHGAVKAVLLVCTILAIAPRERAKRMRHENAP